MRGSSSAPPASRSKTDTSGISERRAAITHPAEPAPMITKSNPLSIQLYYHGSSLMITRWIRVSNWQPDQKPASDHENSLGRETYSVGDLPVTRTALYSRAEFGITCAPDSQVYMPESVQRETRPYRSDPVPVQIQPYQRQQSWMFC